MSCEDLCTGDEAGIYTCCSGVRSVLMHTRSHNNASGQCRDSNGVIYVVVMPVTGLYSVGRLARNLISGSRLNYYWVVFKSHLGCRRIGIRLVYLGSSTVLAAGLYSKG